MSSMLNLFLLAIKSCLSLPSLSCFSFCCCHSIIKILKQNAFLIKVSNFTCTVSWQYFIWIQHSFCGFFLPFFIFCLNSSLLIFYQLDKFFYINNWIIFLILFIILTLMTIHKLMFFTNDFLNQLFQLYRYILFLNILKFLNLLSKLL